MRGMRWTFAATLVLAGLGTSPDAIGQATSTDQGNGTQSKSTGVNSSKQPTADQIRLVDFLSSQGGSGDAPSASSVALIKEVVRYESGLIEKQDAVIRTLGELQQATSKPAGSGKSKAEAKTKAKTKAAPTPSAKATGRKGAISKVVLQLERLQQQRLSVMQGNQAKIEVMITQITASASASPKVLNEVKAIQSTSAILSQQVRLVTSAAASPAPAPTPDRPPATASR